MHMQCLCGIMSILKKVFDNLFLYSFLPGSREEMYESMESQSERLLEERETELRKRLQSFEEGNTK